MTELDPTATIVYSYTTVTIDSAGNTTIYYWDKNQTTPVRVEKFTHEHKR